MPRKNIKDFTMIQIKKSIAKKLTKLKIHPKQSYSEVIEKMLENEEQNRSRTGM